MTQEPLYPEGHPKRIEQESQEVSTDAPSHPRKKKKDDRNLHASNHVAATPESPNDASVSKAETQSGDEHEPNDNINSDVHKYAQPSNDKDVEIEPSVDLDNPQPKNRRYDKNDFAARKHDMLKMSPYAKYMKDIVTNKRRIPDLEISAMLANYTFKGGTPKKLEQVLKAQNDLLNELNDKSVRVITRGGSMTQEPLYPEGHPKRIEQDSQGVSIEAPSHPRKKKKDDRNLHASNPVAVTPENPNDISVSDAETQSGYEHEPNDNIDSDVHDDAQPSNDKDVEIEPVDLDNPQPKKNHC
ncbi:hypothetical protein ZWY2020_037161 [Hordeum vulgare]|nr:hypothetical protein ZWY2020_037161 [Hordeum vulgare]